MNKTIRVVIVTLLGLGLVACGAATPTAASTPTQPSKLVMMLDWVPNTNHTGIFVAQAKGYFQEAGLEASIIQPGEVYAEQAVVSGAADFGISFQEQVTLLRATQVPIVSIAAVIQHNTSGFASRAELGVRSPADWEGLRYGAFGSPFEEPTLRVLMECAGGDFSKLKIVDTGFADPLALLDEKQVDLAWIFYAWQGKQAELKGIDLNIIMMADWFTCIPDYYTPVVVTSEDTIKNKPQLVRSFLGALSRGYTFAIQDPEAAAAILLQEVPELGKDLVQSSQAWLSPRYQAEAARWGEQQQSVWEGYAGWMLDHGIIKQAIDAKAAYTNEFLP